MTNTIFIFRRDFRLYDNIGLNYAIQNYQNIIPIFIFTPEQITNKNTFKSNNAIQFMCESLQQLDKDLKSKNSKLHVFNGDNIEILQKINKKITITNIVFNKDYTPYAIKRDNEIKDFCEKNNINLVMTEDYLLDEMGTFLKKDLLPYTVFTPFKNNAMKFKIQKPQKIKIKNLIKKNSLPESSIIKYIKNNNILVNGGRKNGLNMLNKIKNHSNYNKDRNELSLSTTHLSAFIKFGCISIREVYWEIKEHFTAKNNILSQIFWREFYFYIAYYFPYVLNGKNYNTKYDKIKWNKNMNFFDKWKNAQTGYPIIDAAMTELNTTGYMHNRARLITSNFLNRLLGYHWTIGEKYYATQLTDYDPSVNNGNWQWIASTGVDPKPYFQRLFNPILQSKKFDKNAEYIKKWLPQLNHIPAKHIHDWEKFYLNYDLQKIKYYKPIVNYKESREKSVKMYREVLNKK